MALSIFIAAVARFYRESVEHALERDPRTSVMGTAASAEDVVASLGVRVPDVVILDAAMPDAPAVVRELIRSTGAKVVVAGIHSADEAFGALARAGMRGFVTHEDSLEALIAEVVCAADDRLPCSERMATALFDQLTRIAAYRGSDEARLTAREEEILDLIAEDLSNREIATRLSIQPATVKNHVHNILEKLGVNRRQEAVRRRPRVPAEQAA